MNFSASSFSVFLDGAQKLSLGSKRRECHCEWHENAPRPHAGIQEKWALHNLSFNLKVAFLIEAD
jgi:hypothetical protein